MNSEMIDTLRGIPLLAALGTSELEHIASVSTITTYRRMSPIYYREDRETCAVFVVDGSAKTIATSGDAQVIKRFVHVGHLCNDMALFDMPTADELHSMRKGAVVLRIPIQTVQKLMLTDPAFGGAIHRYAQERRADVEFRFMRIMLGQLGQNIKDMLHDMAVKGRKVGFDVEIEHHYTREEMAQFVGTDRQTFDRHMARLIADGVLSIPSRERIMIHEISKLKNTLLQ